MNWPKSNRVFWANKFKLNQKRDTIVNKTLKRQGWKVIRLWEHELKNTTKILKKFIYITNHE